MANHKQNVYNEKDEQLAKYAKALAHPARIAILRQLALMDTCCFGDINCELPLSQSTVSQHLLELKNAGIIQGCLEPPKVKYCINKENWEDLKIIMKEFFNTEINKK
ncbi:MAG: transcriptional regulator [Bacteroidetes bacterium GWE2_29_8]|nr:MAG: transcriptional regulator [Bacteroidetes bacterium GWE2_29_8]OFY23388.1 MAG: transcriptional regulator [Bacteroidetes bacterium GWF2_29_10]